MLRERVADVELALGPRQRHVEQPPLLVQFLLRLRRVLAREDAVDGLDEEDGVELQPLGRMHGREDQGRLVLVGALGLAGGEVERVEREAFEKRAAARVRLGERE